MCDSAVGMEPYFPSDSPFERPPHPSPLPLLDKIFPFPSSLDKIPHGLLPPTISHQQSKCMKYEELLSCYLALWFQSKLLHHLTLCQCEPNLLHFLPLALSNIGRPWQRWSSVAYLQIFAPEFLILYVFAYLPQNF